MCIEWKFYSPNKLHYIQKKYSHLWWGTVLLCSFEMFMSNYITAFRTFKYCNYGLCAHLRYRKHLGCELWKEMWFPKKGWKSCHGLKLHNGPKSSEIYCSGSWWPLSLTIFASVCLKSHWSVSYVPLIWTKSLFGTWLLPSCSVFEWLSVYEQIYMYFKDLGWPFSITVLCQTVFNICLHLNHFPLTMWYRVTRW